jgi:WD40 repeat protein
MSFHPKLHRIMTGRVGGVTVWDLESGQEVSRFQLAGELIRLQFAPDGQRFAAVQWSDGRWVVSVHSATNGASLASHPFTDRVESLRWHPSGRWVSAPDFRGTVHLIDSQTGETRALGQHKAQAVLTDFSPDGAYLVSGGWDRELICWDLRRMQSAFTIALQSFVPQFRADGRELAIVTHWGVQIRFELPPVTVNWRKIWACACVTWRFTQWSMAGGLGATIVSRCGI